MLVEPMITVLIPTYRRPQLLARAVRSVLTQSERRVIVKVFDNASGDETKQVIANISEADSRLYYHEHSENIGALANFEYSFTQITTPFFAVLSDDDYWLPGAFERALNDLSRWPMAWMWAGLLLRVTDDGRIVDVRSSSWPESGIQNHEERFRLLTYRSVPIWTSCLFRTEALGAVGGLDASIGPQFDLNLIIRVGCGGSFILSHHPSAVFTLHRNSFGDSAPLSIHRDGWSAFLTKLRSGEGINSHMMVALADLYQRDLIVVLWRQALRALFKRNRDASIDAHRVIGSSNMSVFRKLLFSAFFFAVSHSKLIERIGAILYFSTERLWISRQRSLQTRYGPVVEVASRVD